MHRSFPRYLALTVALSLILALLGLWSIHPAAAQGAAQKQVRAAEVNDSYVFQPGKITVSVGTKVWWTNKTDAPHTVTSKTGGWTFDKNLNENAKLSFVFHKVGTYRYICKYHAGMAGVIVVR